MHTTHRPIGRQQIIDTLKSALEETPFARAAWLGGSDASGRTDAWSDVDLQVVVEDGASERALEAIHGALEGLSPIAHRFRMPSPTWHGHEQEFLSLRDADPNHMVDLVVIERSKPDWFLEPERHGTPLVLFDKDGIVAPAPFDRKAHAQKMARRLATLRETFPIFQNVVTKAVRRRAAADAMAAYAGMTMRPLIEVLRMRHAPDLFDYGPRYLDRDLPEGVRAEVEALAIPGSLDAIETCRVRAEALFNETLAALDRGEWSLPNG